MTPLRPRLKRHVDALVMGDEMVILKGAGLFVRLAGEGVQVLVAVLPYLDGTRDVDDIARASGQAPADVRDVLDVLAQDHALEEAAHDEEYLVSAQERECLAPQLALFSHLTTNPAKAQNRLARAKVLVIGDGSLAREAARILADAGVGSVERAGEAAALAPGIDHVLVATDEPAPSRFLAVNDACLGARIPWTGVFLDGLEATVGPTVIPWQTACWRCYDLRVKGAHPNMDRLMLHDAAVAERAPRDARVAFPSFAAVVGAWAAQVVLAHVSRATLPPLAGKVSRVELLALRATTHRVLRMPRCPACSPTAVPDVDRFSLEPVGLR